MLIVTAGGWAEHYAPRGINGPIDDILFPIQHGMLFYPGFEVLAAAGVLPHGENGRAALRRSASWASGWIRCGKRAHPIPPAESRRLSDPVADAAPGAGAGQSGLALHLTTNNVFPAIALPGYHLHSYDNCEPPRNNGIHARHRPSY
jgi:NAD(P)H dehydrogenase (quinone)